MPATVLTASDLQIDFRNAVSLTAVRQLQFSLKRGETLAVVGESGSGKSVTALSLIGLLPSRAHVSGTLELRTRDGRSWSLHQLKGTAWEKIRGRHVSIVFQEPMSALNPVMTVGRQLSEAIQTHQHIPRREIKSKALQWLADVQLPEPENIYSRFPHQLSGGQKQRVMIAMAMCQHPDLLIADEPTTALDVTVQQEIIRLMSDLQKRHGTAIIFITHDLALAASIANQVVVLHQGNLVESGAVDQVLKMPEHPYTQALLACRPQPANRKRRLPVVSDFLAGEVHPVPVFPEYKQPGIPPGGSEAPLLCVENLCVTYSRRQKLFEKKQWFTAVRDVSFTLRHGETLGVVGESGCGKSTLGRSIIGLQPFEKGMLTIEGKKIRRFSGTDWKTVRRQVQFIFQDPYGSLNPRMTVGSILEEPMKIHRTVPEKELRKEAGRLLDQVELPQTALTKYPHEFSGGQRQRIAIARALAIRPKVLICDEIVSALDLSIQARILNLLMDLQEHYGLSYLFISHDLSVVHHISDRILVMQAGRIVEEGNATAILEHPEDSYTRKLVSAVPRII